jgi:hypothetical protein
MSHLQNKSETLKNAAQLSHTNGYYAAVAHSAYYCCLQLMRHIWLYSIGKTEADIDSELRKFNLNAASIGKKPLGTHEFLIKTIGLYIRTSGDRSAYKDYDTFRNHIWKLKNFRTNADYSDSPFNISDSAKALSLSNTVTLILKKY